MAPHLTNDTDVPAPNLLSHLQQALGSTELQALEALGQYLMSTRAGRALREELDDRHAQRMARARPYAA